MKPKASSKSSLEAASPLNSTVKLVVPSNAAKQKEKAVYVWVQKSKIHIPVIPKTSEGLIKKDSVTLSPSTSKLPPQLHISTTSFPKHVSDSEEAVSFNAGSPPFSGKPSPPSTPESNSEAVSFNAGSPPFSGKPSPPSTPESNSEAVSFNAGFPSFSGKHSPPSTPESNASSSKPGKKKNKSASSSKRGKRNKNYDKPLVYSIPKAIERMIKEDKVPNVLLKPLSPSTYKHYFAALLYAEDYYIEKWNGFTLVDVSLKIYKNDTKENKIFVAFEIDSVPERRPFLLSRDFVFAKPSGEQRDPFKGFVKRVKKSTLLIVEFGEDFLSQHRSLRRYDVSFSFNRVCLKRSHQAIAAASDMLVQSFIFPDNITKTSTPTCPENWFCHKLSVDQKSAVLHILSSHGPPAYLVKGPLCVTSAEKNPEQLSETGMVIKEAVLQILRSSSACRVLICAPLNNTCDLLVRSLKKEIPESEMFRANAAFREIHGVPIDILGLSLYEGECFNCPSLQELKKYRVILSTFISSFRLCHEGLPGGHFSHIFLVDASSASEPETMVALSNFATAETTVVVTGSRRNSSSRIRSVSDRIRSDIARKHGLRLSYFQRLVERRPYIELDPIFITKLV